MKTIKPQQLGVLCRTFDSGDGFFFAVSALAGFEFSRSAPAAGAPSRGLVSEVALWKLAEAGLRGQGQGKGQGEEALDLGMPKLRAEALVAGGYAAQKDAAAAPRIQIGAIDKSLREQAQRFSPLDIASPERARRAGTFDDAWRQERFPGFPRDMDWAFFNAAPADQQIDGFFRGDESFVVSNMHPEQARIEGRLPAVRARAFVALRGEEALRELPMALDTLWLFPRAESAVLVWHGVIEVQEDDGSDVANLVLGCEDLAEDKGMSHYRDVLAQRLDPKKGHLFVLRDRDLMPDGFAAAHSAAEAAERSLFAAEGLLRKNMSARLERERAQAAAHARALGIELPPVAAPIEPDPQGDDDAAIEIAAAQAERAQQDAEREKAAAERQFRAACTARGLDPDQVKKDAEASAAGPPKFSAAEELAKLRALRSVGRSMGGAASAAAEIDAMLADPGFAERLVAMEGMMREAYRRFVHHYPAAARLPAERSLRARAEVAARRRQGKSLSGCDFTGADLSGLDLAGADLKGALLEAADLHDCKLDGADLSDAVLARADMQGASLRGCKLTGANLGRCKLARAALVRADLSGAALVGADLANAKLSGARLQRADLSEAMLSGADLSRAKANEARFIKTDLRGAKLCGADLSDASFIEATLADVDLSNAKLTSATLYAASAAGAIFRDAQLDNLRATNGSSLARADLRGAHLQGANLRGCALPGADLGGASLVAADFSECDLSGANLSRADAREARFVRADLRAAKAASVNLMEASLAKADLRGADLSRSNLFRAGLERAQIDDATLFDGCHDKRARRSPPQRARGDRPGGWPLPAAPTAREDRRGE